MSAKSEIIATERLKDADRYGEADNGKKKFIAVCKPLDPTSENQQEILNAAERIIKRIVPGSEYTRANPAGDTVGFMLPASTADSVYKTLLSIEKEKLNVR